MSPEETQARFRWYGARIDALRRQAYELLWEMHYGFCGHDSGIPENCTSSDCRRAMEVIGDEPWGV